MAINFFETYPTEVRPPDSEYPFGSFRNASSPTSVDGTKLEERWSNDFFAFQWALLKNAGMTPNGQIDTATNSQYFDALLKVIADNVPDISISNATDGNRTDWVASEKAVGDLSRVTVKKAGDTMTGRLVMQNSTIRHRATNIPANNRGAVVDFTNQNGTGVFTTSAENGTNAITHRLPNQSGTLALGGIISGQQNGYWRDPSTGLMIQWGVTSSYNVSFPISFNINCFSLSVTHTNGTQPRSYLVNNITKNGFRWSTDGNIAVNTSWLAIGI